MTGAGLRTTLNSGVEGCGSGDGVEVRGGGAGRGRARVIERFAESLALRAGSHEVAAAPWAAAAGGEANGEGLGGGGATPRDGGGSAAERGGRDDPLVLPSPALPPESPGGRRTCFGGFAVVSVGL